MLYVQIVRRHTILNLAVSRLRCWTRLARKNEWVSFRSGKRGWRGPIPSYQLHAAAEADVTIMRSVERFPHRNEACTKYHLMRNREITCHLDTTL